MLSEVALKNLGAGTALLVSLLRKPSAILYPEGEAVMKWICKGRFQSCKGWSIFFRDSIGDLQKECNSSSPSPLSSSEEVASRPIILLLHGLPTSSFDFKDLYEMFATKYHVIAIDLLGCGMSDKPSNISYTSSQSSSRGAPCDQGQKFLKRKT
jgi:pimeloyl-ACP methyl ester carboxylesterase